MHKSSAQRRNSFVMISPRHSSFSVISSEDHQSEVEWFDTEPSGIAGVFASPCSNNTEFLSMHDGSNCTCHATRMIIYYEERLANLQSEVETLRGLLAKYESQNSTPVTLLESIKKLIFDIMAVGSNYQFELTNTTLSLFLQNNNQS